MNDFFLREFSISKIDLCVFVEKGKGTKHHTNIPNHRLVYIAETGEEKIYKFKNDVSLAVKSKEIIYLPKFSSYDVMSSKTGDCFAINFGLSNPDLTFPPFVLKENFAEKYSSDFKEILKLWERRKNGDINKCYSILYGIISKIQKDMTADYVPPKNKKIAFDSMEYIAAHYHDKSLSVEFLAEIHNITPQHFRNIFKSTYKISPKQFIIDYRIKIAKKLLLSGEFKIYEIAEMCGFESESYFSRKFKKICGCSPSKYSEVI